MGKRAPSDEKPFRPLDASILSDVAEHRAEPQSPSRRSVEVGDGAPRLRPTDPMSKPHPSAPLAARPHVHRLDQEKRILFTREESQAIDRLVNNLAVRLSAQVKVSHVIRALTSLLLRSEREIDRRAGERGTLIRPPNGDFSGLQQFELAIADILANAFRDSGRGGT